MPDIPFSIREPVPELLLRTSILAPLNVMIPFTVRSLPGLIVRVPMLPNTILLHEGPFVLITGRELLAGIKTFVEPDGIDEPSQLEAVFQSVGLLTVPPIQSPETDTLTSSIAQ